jgi:hypothetical protein
VETEVAESDEAPTVFVPLKGPSYEEVDPTGPFYLAGRLSNETLSGAHKSVGGRPGAWAPIRRSRMVLLALLGLLALSGALVLGQWLASRLPGTPDPIPQGMKASPGLLAPAISSEEPVASAADEQRPAERDGSETAARQRSQPAPEVWPQDASTTRLSELLPRLLWPANDERDVSVTLTRDLSGPERQLLSAYLGVASQAAYRQAVELATAALDDPSLNGERAAVSELIVGAYRAFRDLSAKMASCGELVAEVPGPQVWSDRLTGEATSALEPADEADTLPDCGEADGFLAWRPDVFTQLTSTATALQQAGVVLEEGDPLRDPLLARSLLSYELAEYLLAEALTASTFDGSVRSRAEQARNQLRVEMAEIQLARGSCDAAQSVMASPELAPADYVSLRSQSVACELGPSVDLGEVTSRLQELVETGAALRRRGQLVNRQLRRVHIHITSDPPRARLYQEDTPEGRVQLGRTPYDATLESDSPTITLLLSKRRHRARTIEIDMTAGDVDRHVRMRPRRSSRSRSETTSLAPID